VQAEPPDRSTALPEAALRTLVRLRWGLVSIQVLSVGFTARVVGQEVEALAVAALVLFQLVTNVTVLLVHRHGRLRSPAAQRRWVAALLAFDIACLTFMIHFSGGPANPFGSLFVIHALVAVVVLPPRHSLAFAGLACLGYLSVFVLATGGRFDAVALDVVGHEMHAAVAGHLVGMWVSLALTIAAVTVFGGQLLLQLRQKEQALSRAEADAIEARRVASLTAFAAGAAHELSTPLSTIAVVASELLRPRRDRTVDAETLRDLNLVRSEVDRCQRIVQSLRYDLDYAPSRADVPFDRELYEELALLLGRDALERVRYRVDLPVELGRLPTRGLAQAVAALIRNSLDASGPGQPIDLRLTASTDRLALSVIDRGRGIPAEDLPKVQEPFFSRRPSGEGLGLGLFLARVICDQLRATLTLQSEVGRGTVATIDVPRFARP
jgi:two-component system sensor histidine kinase RegB